MTPLEIRLRDHLHQVAAQVHPTRTAPTRAWAGAATTAHTPERSCAMASIPIHVRAIGVLPGDTIIRHPHAPHQEGEWTVTGAPTSDGWYVAVGWSAPSGECGVFKLSPGERLIIRARGAA